MSAPDITDHALVRFLDRGGGCDVEELRAQIAASLTRAHSAARAVSTSDYLVTVDGLTFVVRGERVTTVLTDATIGQKAHSLARGGHEPA
ncbi:hypothetical protein [Pelagerythrobacter marinus]|uniref:hypothetical protein n=1 Tax=Pelagerythrobacter marinus TaxID=538382 RepID=UPI002AC94204|nr:hypothetical protein [Pelagerythrobacter marinus]WPZ06597.1 hypothetical protein T8T98_14465 [Pelagerythrobacter marinus]